MFSAADDAAAGIPVTRSPYPDGEEGITGISLPVMAQKIREGATTAVMRSYAGNVLKRAGFPRGIKERAAAFLTHIRNNVTYAPDPQGTETIQSAAVTLCVDGAPVCIPIEDCDGLSVALGTLCGAAGMNVRIVRQYFGGGLQQHVLVEVQGEGGEWIPLDPSSSRMPAGVKAQAQRETRHEVWPDGAVGVAEQAQFVGIGKLKSLPASPLAAEVVSDDEWQRVEAGLGRVPESVSPFDTVLASYDRKLGNPIARRASTLGFLSSLVDNIPPMDLRTTLAASAAIIVSAVAVAVVVKETREKRTNRKTFGRTSRKTTR